MTLRKERYTVAFDEIALDAMSTVTTATNYREVPDFIRASVTVMIDLLDATGRKLTVVLRDDATGREWEYSPHQPGRAVPIEKTGTEPLIDNVFRPAFGSRRENEIALGVSAPTQSSGDKMLDDRRKQKKVR